MFIPGVITLFPRKKHSSSEKHVSHTKVSVCVPPLTVCLLSCFISTVNLSVPFRLSLSLLRPSLLRREREHASFHHTEPPSLSRSGSRIEPNLRSNYGFLRKNSEKFIWEVWEGTLWILFFTLWEEKRSLGFLANWCRTFGILCRWG